MGMYDYVSNKIMQKYIKSCPYCGKEFDDNTEWQTKNFQQMLEEITEEEFEDLGCVSAICECNNCKSFIDVKRWLPSGLEKVKYTKVEIEYNIYEKEEK